MEIIIKIRNLIISFVYQNILKRIYFLFDSEKVHNRMVNFGEFLGCYKFTRFAIKSLFYYQNKKLEQEILGIRFSNPVGIAAGFDKNALLTQILPSVGFGFAEVGSITGKPCSGNPGPRLWRLPKSRALVVYYGLMNDGAEIISQRLKNKKFNFPVGVSLAKTNSPLTVDLEAGIADYFKSYKEFYNSGIGDYYTINISCPNAFGGEPFTNQNSLDMLLSEFNKQPKTKPIFIKLAPDLSHDELDKIIKVCCEHKIDGFVSSNLTKNRNNLKIKDKTLPPKGGISGKAVEHLTNEQIKYIYSKTQGEFVIIGCGGVFSAQDAYKKIRLGASLIQLITGMIYQGPQLISEINQGLVRLIEKDGFESISEAIGIDNT